MTVAAFLVAAWPAAAQSFGVPAHVVAGGGAHATGGTYTVTGTVGQPVATMVSRAGGTYRLVSGFWHVAPAIRTILPFTDPVLTQGGSVIRAIHLVELRQRIDALRGRFGLSAYPWTDPTLTIGSTAARAVHFTDLRNALSQAYAAAGQSPPGFSAVVGAGAIITAAAVLELRNAVIALE